MIRIMRSWKRWQVHARGRSRRVEKSERTLMRSFDIVSQLVHRASQNGTPTSLGIEAIPVKLFTILSTVDCQIVY